MGNSKWRVCMQNKGVNHENRVQVQETWRQVQVIYNPQMSTKLPGFLNTQNMHTCASLCSSAFKRKELENILSAQYMNRLIKIYISSQENYPGFHLPIS